MKILRIKDWAKTYENNRTRELKYMEWIPIPNKHDGDGYTLLVDRKNGAEMLGAWLAILQVASKCGVRGTLLRDGATPHDSASISRMTRISKDSIEKALLILINDCKWVEIIDENNNPAPSCDNPAPRCGEVTTERNGTERNGIEEREREFPETPPLSRQAFSELALIRGVPKECADWFWNTHDARNWTDATGQPIKKVEPLLLNAFKNWRASNGNPATKPKRTWQP